MLGNIGKMMKLAGEMKTKMPEMQAKLAASEYTAPAGGGAVQATVNGKGALTGIRLDKAILNEARDETEMLEDLIVAAVSAAQGQAASAAAEAMKELTGGLELPGGLGL